MSGEYFFISFILNHKARILPSPPSLHAARAAIVRVRSWIRYDDSSIQQFEETAKDSKLGFPNRVLPKRSLNDHPQRGSFVQEGVERGSRDRLNLLQTSFRRSCLQIRRRGTERESEMVRADFRSFQLTRPPPHRPVSDEQDGDLDGLSRVEGARTGKNV